jgi:hypothetical protein
LISHYKPARWNFTLLLPPVPAVVEFLFCYFYEEKDLLCHVIWSRNYIHRQQRLDLVTSIHWHEF